jgi:phosphoglycerate dehydrogenase-like enzyme
MTLRDYCPWLGTEEVADSALSHVLNHFRQTGRAVAGVAAARATAGHRAAIAEERAATRMRGKTLGLVGLGLSRIVALYCRSSTSYRNREHVRCLYV